MDRTEAPPASGADEAFRDGLLSIQEAVEPQDAGSPVGLDLANDPELVQEFLLEAGEHLANVETAILALERNEGDAESLNGVFRCFHTIKGLAGFLGAVSVEEIAHETENVLGLIRSGHLALTPDVTELILRAADELKHCLADARPGNLHQLPRCDRALLKAIAAAGRRADSTVPAVPGLAATQRPAAEGPVQTPAGESGAVRIALPKLEYLIDMVGELVIASSVVAHHPLVGNSSDAVLTRNVAQLVRVMKEVQKTSMSMRMVAVGTLFRRMSRLTRDLARKSGKIIDLVTVGDDVELDRNIVEELADPMVHMIRNAVDHGLESAVDRALAGKPETGTIRLRAMHDAGDIVIEIGDDGRGLNPARILAKAKGLGLVNEHEQPEEEAIFRLIFEPGFSTTETVTEMSGRGVGMDVVMKQIQKLRGRVSIRSSPGAGCTFALRLPLTLAIIDGLVVRVGCQRYIVPMFAVREIFPVTPDTFITLENRAEAALLRETLLPVIRLTKLFAEEERDRNDNILISIESCGRLVCIAVDELIGKQEVVIKSLGRTFREVPAICGGAILGDGRVGLIIDVNSLGYRN